MWLSLEGIAFSWRPTALLGGRIHADRAVAALVHLRRRPVAQAVHARKDDGHFSLLPIALHEGRIDLLAVEPAVIGSAAHLKVAARIMAGKPGEDLEGRVGIAHADGRPGRLDATLVLRPDTAALTVDATVSEPAGGLLGRLLDLPGLPALEVRLKGNGSLDDWKGTVTADGGRTLSFSGDASIRRDGRSRKFNGQIRGRADGLLPSKVAPLLAGRTTVSVDGRWDDSGHLVLHEAKLDAPLLTGAAHGVVEPQRRFVHGSLDLRLRDDGTTPLQLPIEANHAISLSGGHISFVLDPAAENRRVTIRASLKDVVWGELKRETVAVTASGTQPAPFDRGWLDFSQLEIDAETLGARTRFAGALADLYASGRIEATIDRLEDVAGLLPTDAVGRLEFVGNGDFSLRSLEGSGDISARLQGVRLGRAPLVKILEGASGFSAHISHSAGQLTSIENGKVQGDELQGTFSGRHGPDVADAAFELALGRLERLHGALRGSVKASGRISAFRSSLSGNVSLEATSAAGRGAPIETLAVNAALAGTLDAPAAKLTLNGRHGGHPLSGGLYAALEGGGGGRLEGLDLRYGSSKLSGDAILATDGTLAADISADIPKLAEFAGVLGIPLGGSGALRLSRPANARDAGFVVDGKARDILVGTSRVGSAKLAGRLGGSLAAPRGQLRADVSGIETGGITVETSSLDARLDKSLASFAVRAKGPGLVASLDATADAAAREVSLTFDDGRLAYRGFAAKLAKPATFTFPESGIATNGAVLSVGRGRLELSGKAGDKLDATVRAVGLSASEIALPLVPELAIEGAIDGTIRIDGTRTRPRATYEARWRNASAKPLRDANLPSVSLSSRGTWQADRLDFDADIAGPSGLDVRGKGTIDTSARRIASSKLTGSIPFSLALAPLADRGTRGSGVLRLDAAASGAFSGPNITGAIQLRDGALADPSSGLSLSSLNAAGRLVERDLLIDRLAGDAPRGGRLSGRGNISLDPATDFLANLTLAGQSLSYDDRTAVKALADADVVISGPLAREPRIAGTIRMARADITISEQQPRSLVELDIRHVGVSTADRKRLGLPDETRTRQADRPVAIDLSLSSDGRIYVRGRGVEAELGGDLRLHGNSLDVLADGQFVMRRGSMALLGRRLQLTRGTITFPGRLDPVLNLEATTSAGSTSITAMLAGRASDPRLKFSSSPDLPQDEILALLIFGRSLTKLSPIQLAQLANEIDRLGGITGGSGMLDQLRRSVGVDRLDVTTDDKGNAAISAGSNIADSVYLGVKQNAGTGASSVVIDLDITKNIKARGESGSDGNSKLGLGVEFSY